MSQLVIEAPPASRESIRATAELVRRLAERELNTSGSLLPIIDVIEFVLPRIDPAFELHVLPKEEMGADHGLTIPSQHIIKLREDVYDRAVAGHGRDRATAAHEVGHYFLHHDVGLPRRMKESQIKAYRSSEWQAKCFAGELLVCARMVTTADTPGTIARRFGVSLAAAEYQLNQLKKEGRI